MRPCNHYPHLKHCGILWLSFFSDFVFLEFTIIALFTHVFRFLGPYCSLSLATLSQGLLWQFGAGVGVGAGVGGCQYWLVFSWLTFWRPSFSSICTGCFPGLLHRLPFALRLWNSFWFSPRFDSFFPGSHVLLFLCFHLVLVAYLFEQVPQHENPVELQKATALTIFLPCILLLSRRLLSGLVDLCTWFWVSPWALHHLWESSATPHSCQISCLHLTPSSFFHFFWWLSEVGSKIFEPCLKM